MKQVSYGCLGRSLEAYLHVEGLTKPPASALVQNLSPYIYGWKDESSHSRVFWLKFKFLYLWVEGQTKSLTSALVKINAFPSSGGRTNQVIHECLGRNLSLSTSGRKDDQSHLRVPWLKFKVLVPTGERTNQATSKCLCIKYKSFYLRVEGRTKSLMSFLVEI